MTDLSAKESSSFHSISSVEFIQCNPGTIYLTVDIYYMVVLDKWVLK